MSDYWQEQRYLAAHYALHGHEVDDPEPQPHPVRVLVTGSREFTSVHLARTALRTVIEEHGTAATIVHGDARGADRIAARIAEAWGMATEARPADWANLGRKAGVVRNAEMVRDGADLCLVFLVAGLPCVGTRDCMRRAERAGIPVRVYEQGAAR